MAKLTSEQIYGMGVKWVGKGTYTYKGKTYTSYNDMYKVVEKDYNAQKGSSNNGSTTTSTRKRTDNLPSSGSGTSSDISPSVRTKAMMPNLHNSPFTNKASKSDPVQVAILEREAQKEQNEWYRNSVASALQEKGIAGAGLMTEREWENKRGSNRGTYREYLDKQANKYGVDSNKNEVRALTKAEKTYLDLKNNATAKTTITSNLSDADRKKRIDEINKELNSISARLSGYTRARGFDTSGYIVEAEKKDKARMEELKSELKSLERVGTFTGAELNQFKLDDARAEAESLKKKIPTGGRISTSQAEAYRTNAQAYRDASKKVDELEKTQAEYGKIEKLEKLNEHTRAVMSNDDFDAYSKYSPKALKTDEQLKAEGYRQDADGSWYKLSAGGWGGSIPYTGEDSAEYIYINDPNRRDELDLNARTSSSVNPYRTNGYHLMTEDEIGAYNYLYNKDRINGTNKAGEYLQKILPMLQERALEEESKRLAGISKESPVAASMVSLGTNFANALMAPTKVAATVTGSYDDFPLVDAFGNATSAIRGGVSEDMGTVGGFLYNAGMSIGDMGVAMLAGGGNANLVQAIMSSSAGSSTISEAKKNGASDGKALVLGLGSAAIEWATEKYSIEEILKNPKTIRGYIAKNTFTEATEEGTSNLLNVALDTVVSEVFGERNEIEQRIDYLVLYEGKTENEAFKIAFNEKLQSLGEDVLVGGLSGAGMSSAVASPIAVQRGIDKIHQRNATTTSETAQPDSIEQAARDVVEDQNTAAAQPSKKTEIKPVNVGDVYESEGVVYTITSREKGLTTYTSEDASGNVTNHEVLDDMADYIFSQDKFRGNQEEVSTPTEATSTPDTLEQAARETVESRSAGKPLSTVQTAEKLSMSGAKLTVEEAKQASGYGEAGAKVLADLVNSAQDKSFSQVKSDMHTSYLAGLSNKTIKSEGSINMEAYLAGKTDREVSKIKATEGIFKNRVFSREESGLITPESKNKGNLNPAAVPKTVSRKMAKALDVVGKALGRKVMFVDSITVNGQEDAANAQVRSDGVFEISVKSEQPLYELLFHEPLHIMRQENTAEYHAFVDFALQHAEYLDRRLELGHNTGTKFEGNIAQYQKYDLSIGYDANIEEIAAHFAEKLASGDRDAIRLIEKMAQDSNSRTALQKFFDVLKDVIDKCVELWNRLRKQGEYSAAEELGITISELKKAKELYAKALTATQKVATERANEQNTKSENKAEPSGNEGYTSSFSFNESFGKQLDDWLEGNGKVYGSYNGNYFELGTTPDILVKHGAPEGDVIMYEDCLLKIAGLKHSIDLTELAKIPSQLNDPILLFKGSVKDSFVALTELKAKNGHDVIVAIHINKRQGRTIINKIASVYSKTNNIGENKITDYVTQQIEQGNLLDASIKKAPLWFTASGLQLPHAVQTIIDAKISVPQNPKSVKSDFSLKEDINKLSPIAMENRIFELREEMSEIQDELDFGFDLTDAEEKKLNNKLIKLQHELDELVAAERKASVRTSIPNIIKNLSKYRLSDLHSLAEQVSDSAWDDYEDLSREELESALEETLTSRLDDLEPEDKNNSRYGFSVRPIQETGKVVQLKRETEGDSFVEPNIRYSFKDSDYLKAVESGDMETAQKMVEETANSLGYNIRAYHGTARGDRVGNVFLPERATSGPMAFFTSDKQIAENYSKSKQDTSMAYDPDYDRYETQFRVKAKNQDLPLYRAWTFLPNDAKKRITEKAGQLREDWDGDYELILDPETNEGNGGFQWQLKEARGNAIQALTEQWLNSGTLFGDEGKFLEVLEMVGVNEEFKKLGMDAPYFKDPNAKHEKVYDTFLKITKPFDTATVNEEFIADLENWYDEQDQSKYDVESMRADLWDKNNRDAYEFADILRDDLEHNTTHAWTSVPDAVTDFLKSKGYDGIKDTGGKYSGESHIVYIPFSSEQIKAADAVTYDNDGNVIPLSERFNTSNVDIRYSLKSTNLSTKDTKALLDIIEHLKGEFEVTKFAKADPKKLAKMTKDLLKEYSSQADLDKTTKAIDDLYQYLANGEDGHPAAWNDVYSKAYDIAENIINNALVVDDELYTTYKGLREYLRKTPIRFDSRYDSVPSGYDNYQDFRRRNWGRFNFTKNGTSIDKVYQELSDLYPEFFNSEEQINPQDQFERIVEVLDEIQPTEANPYSSDMQQMASFLANDIIDRFFDVPQAKPTFADKAERRVAEARIAGGKKVEAVRQQKDEKIQKLLDKQKAKTKQLIEKAKTKKAEAVNKEKAKRENAISNMKESQKAKVLRAQIMRHANDLSQKLVRPSDNKHIPEDLKGLVAKVLESINLESNYTYDPETRTYKKSDDGLPTRRTKAFEELRKLYKEIASSVVVDPDLLGEDGLLSDVILLADKRVVDMNSTELQTVWKTICAVEASINTANKMFSKGKFETILEAAEKLWDDNNGKKGTYYGKIRKLLNVDMLTPETFLHYLGGAGDSIFRMMRDAQDKHISIMKEVADFTHKTLKGVNVNSLEKTTHTVTLGGEEVQLSTAQLMELYVLTKREQAIDHIFKGGILPDVIAKKKKLTRTEPVRNISMAEVSEALSKLTDDQKKIADKLQKYVSTVLSEYGNEASMQVYNYRKFNEKNYWTIRTNKQEIQSEVGKDTSVTSVANKGMTKSTKPHANTSVRIGSIFDTFAAHSSDMATYAAWLGTSEDVNRIRNFVFWNDKARVGTVKGILDTVHGTKGSAYLEKLLTDIAIGVKGVETMNPFDKLTGNYKAASVGANIRVIIQQPTALLRALDMIGGQHLAAGAYRPLKGWEKAKKYAPIAQWKDWGYFDINTGRQMKDVLFDNASVVEKTKQIGMWGASMADSLAWGQLWNAVESETKAKHKELEVGTDEFYEAVAKRFTEIVDHTQVVDGILQRSQIMRSADNITKMATSFMGEPTKQYNMAISAFHDAHTKKGDARKKAIAKLGRSAMSLAIAGIVNAGAQAIVDALRDDDKEEKYWEKWLANFGKNSLDTANPLNYIPYIKDIVSIVSGYSVTRMDTASLEKTRNAVVNMYKAITGTGKYTIAEASATLFAEVSRLYGVPVANVKRDIKSAVMTFATETDNYLMQYRMEKAMLDINYAGNSKNFVDILYNAYNNDSEAYEIIYNDMVKSGYKVESIKGGMEDRMKKAEGVTKASELEKRYMTPDDEKKYDSSLKRVQSSQAWKSASAEQREDAKADLYSYLTSDSESVINTIEDAKKFGVDETEYTLWNLALDMVDQPEGEKGSGSYDYQEKAEAINMLDFSDEEIAYLFGKGGQESTKEEIKETLEAGIDMKAYVNFKAATSEMKADKDANGKSITGSKQKKIVNYLRSSDFTDEEIDYFWYEVMDYKTKYKW